MCERFIEFRKIIDEITAYQANMTLSSQQINKIKNLSHSEHDWMTIFSLVEVLLPFYQATKMLSGTQYQTAAYGPIILKSLLTFLSSESSSEDLEETNSDILNADRYYQQVNLMKSILLESFETYVKKHISEEQSDSFLIAAYFSIFRQKVHIS